MKNVDFTELRQHLPKIIHPFTISVAFWISVIATIIITGLMLIGNVYTEEQIINTRFHIALLTVANFILFFVLFLFNFHIIKREKSVTYRILISITGTIIITGIYTLLSQKVNYLIYGNPESNNYFFLDIIKDCVVAITVLLITIALFNITRRQQMALENEHLQADNLQIRLTSLENQVDPHFLFNSLNTLDGLIGTDEDRAHKYLQQLATSYRYIMRKQRQVSLEEELSFAESYEYLMRIRYGDNLKVIKQIDPAYLQSQIVPISLQLLLENAIKHNIISDRHPLTITIETTEQGVLRVSNPCQPKESEINSAGVGLANLNKRYQLLFHQEISINNADNQFIVEIPLVR